MALLIYQNKLKKLIKFQKLKKKHLLKIDYFLFLFILLFSLQLK